MRPRSFARVLAAAAVGVSLTACGAADGPVVVDEPAPNLNPPQRPPALNPDDDSVRGDR